MSKIDKEAKRITEKLNELMTEEILKGAVTDNKIEVTIKGKKYRVSKPTLNQRKEINSRKVEKYIELLRNDKYMLEADLKDMYKKRGIDIDDMDKQMRMLMKEKEDHQIQLGKALKNKGSDKEIEIYRQEIEKREEAMQELSFKKSQLLDYSIETQANIHAFSYLIYLIVEVEDKGKWKSPWKSYEDFENTEETLINELTVYVTLMGRQDVDFQLS